MYDVDTGYYTLNSDTNAVYFDGEPKDGATLKITDKPISINYDGAAEASDTIISGNRRISIPVMPTVWLRQPIRSLPLPQAAKTANMF